MTGTRLLGAAVLVAALGLSPDPVRAQGNDYEAIYGRPVDVSLSDLTQYGASHYQRQAVRTRGRLEFPTTLRSETWVLRDTFGASALITPFPEAATIFSEEARSWLGQEVTITGVVVGVPANTEVTAGTNATVGIQFWSFIGPVRKADTGRKATSLTLERLVKSPGRHDGEVVRVLGQFRGKNLYGDLPSRSMRSSSDWVIKDDMYAVWVTGKKSKGRGWALDAGLKRDTGRWMEVVGRVETRGGVSYIEAVEVRLSKPPTPTAEAAPPTPPPPRPKVPPVIVFSLPLDGEVEVPPGSTFTVQFSKDMDEATFKGRVDLRYAGPERPGDRRFVGMKLTYDGGRRALTVDPGDVVRPGRVLELRLLPGIADTDGMALVPRAGEPRPDVVDVLRYRVGG